VTIKFVTFTMIGGAERVVASERRDQPARDGVSGLADLIAVRRRASSRSPGTMSRPIDRPARIDSAGLDDAVPEDPNANTNLGRRETL
jgi:hypothetical protein